MAYLSLSTANLPDPGIDPAQDQEPRDYFETFLYTGNGGGLQVGDVIKKPADTTTISNSLIFNDDDDAYLTWTPSVDGTSSSKFTMSMWFKKTVSINPSGAYQVLFSFGADTNNNVLCYFSTGSNTLDFWVKSGGSYICRRVTDAAYADVSSWYHLVVAYDNDNAGTNDLVKIYINGVQVTDFSSTTNTGGSTVSGTQVRHDIGAWWSTQTTNTFDGCMAEIHFVDGTAHPATDFGNFDANGIWIPKAVTGITYGTNGFYLDFADSSALGDDESGNTNDWTANNFATTDQVDDSPTNNHMNLNSSYQRGSNTFSEGNLNVVVASGSNNSIVSHRLPRTGKHYFEFELDATQGSAVTVGFVDATVASGSLTHYSGTGHFGYYASNGNMYVDASTESYGASYTAGDVIGVAIDFDAKTVQFYKNNTGQGEFDYGSRFSDVKDWKILASNATSSGGHTLIFDFGQKGFTYTEPTGYTAISENNITVDDQNLESPDFVWIKSRDSANKNKLFDSVRGVQKVLDSAAASAEADDQNALLDFNKNGFTVGSNDAVNKSGDDIVAWCWKANGATTVTDTSGSIDSEVSANTTSGFSICTFTPSGSNFTFGHGLDVAPDAVWVKNRDDGAANWVCYQRAIGATKYLMLNSGNAAATSANAWQDTDPTSSVVYVGSFNYANGEDYVAYCFHSVEGFSKIGSYVASSGLPFVYTGFRPAWVMVKRAITSSSGSWAIHDTARRTFNEHEEVLRADSNGTEADGYGDIDILSNGFKMRNTLGTFNSGTDTYVYMAFAENPFKYATAR